jgi:hypothetical protein
MVKAITGFLVSALALAAAPPLKLVRSYPLAGVHGRLDHMAADVEGRRLFVAALGNNTVEVVELDSGRVKTLHGFSKPQGICYVAARKRLFVANGDDGALTVISGATLEVELVVELKRGADLMDYDAGSGRLYVGHGGEEAGEEYGEIAIVDTRSLSEQGSLVTASHPGALLVEPGGKHLFASVPALDEVAVALPGKERVQSMWYAREFRRPASLAYDEAGKRLLVGTRNPPRVLVVNPWKAGWEAALPAPGMLDGLFFDAARRRLYATGGEGFVAVYQQRAADRYEPLDRIPTRAGARTSLYVPEWNRLFVALPEEGNQRAEIRAYETVN